MNHSITGRITGLEFIDEFKKRGLYPYFRVIEGTRGSRVISADKELVMMGSNNYLGLTHDSRVIDAAVQSTKHWGTGCTGSRFLNGNLLVHEELEAELADFLGFEAALVFASGFMANQGAISALLRPSDTIFGDKENHACIIEGCKLSRAKIVRYKHSDMNHLERLLETAEPNTGKLVISDGVFSMTGHIAPYQTIYQLSQKHGATTYIDDAHGIGVVGKGGRGTANHFNLPVDILMGTFSKSLASQGGFICGSKEVIKWLRHQARTFIFSAALSPANASAALEALRILKKTPQLVSKVNENGAYLKKGFDQLGLDTMGTETPIVPVMIGDDQMAFVICKQLSDYGIFVTPVLYPAVPKGEAMIRCSVMASHSKEDLDIAIDAFSKVVPLIKQARESGSGLTLSDLVKVQSSQQAITV